MPARIMGDFRSQKIELPQSYFEQRDCWIDCREPGMIEIDKDANIGWNVTMVCQTHDVTPGYFGRLTGRPIKIGPKAFICAFAILYNCKIGEGAIVAIGSVVRSQDVEAWTMVAGNPAVPIKRYNHTTGKWEKI